MGELTENEKALMMVCVGYANIGLGNKLTEQEREAEKKIVEFLGKTNAKQIAEGVNALYKKLISEHLEG